MTVEIHWPDAERSVQGEPGKSLLEIALENGITLDHACGGVCACSTCHVKITKGRDCFAEPSEDELDQLDEARDVSLDSRLGCQAKLLRVPKDGVVEITIPTWNVNAVREGAGH
jgi:2Fe-2S ferredoxin